MPCAIGSRSTRDTARNPVSMTGQHTENKLQVSARSVRCKLARKYWPLASTMHTEDLKVLIPVVTAAVVAILGAVRLSRCTRIRCCCIECDRQLQDARSKEDPDGGDAESDPDDQPSSPQAPQRARKCAAQQVRVP